MRVTTNSWQQTEALGEWLGSRLSGGEVIALSGRWAWEKRPLRAALPAASALPMRFPAPPLRSSTSTREGCRSTILICTVSIRGDDLYSTGFFDYLGNGGVLVIEWSENIEGACRRTPCVSRFRAAKRKTSGSFCSRACRGRKTPPCFRDNDSGRFLIHEDSRIGIHRGGGLCRPGGG